MSDSKASSAQDKPRTQQKAVFSYARAAQGKQTAQAAPVAASPASEQGANGGKSNTPSAAAPAAVAAPSPAQGTPPAASTPAAVDTKPESTAAASTPAARDSKATTGPASTGGSGHQKGASSGVHMPPRKQESGTPASVQFGNFSNAAGPGTPGPVSQESPAPGKAQPVASGGAPPRVVQKQDIPQFGSFENNENKPVHSRTNSESSEFRPSGMPNYNQGPQQGYYGQAQQGSYGYQSGYSPAMPGYRGPHRGGMNQFNQPRHTPGRPSQAGAPGGPAGNNAAMASPRPGGAAVNSPHSTPQQQHAQMSGMGSPMGSPMYGNYAQMHGQGMYGYPNFSPAYSGQGGYGGYPQSGHLQGGQQPGGYMNQQGRAMPYGGPQTPGGSQQGNPGGNQYQNPNLQSLVPRAGGGGASLSDRSTGTPQQSTAPTFTTPRKSAAIRITRPDTKEEVILPKAEPKRASAATPATAAMTGTTVPAASASPAPSSTKTDRPASSASIPKSSTPAPAVAVQETPEQIKAKNEATRLAFAEKVAARRAESSAKVDEAAAAQKKEEDSTAAAAATAAAASAQKEADEKKVAEKEAKDKADKEAAAAATAAKAKADADAKAEEEAKAKTKADEEAVAAAKKAEEEEEKAKSQAASKSAEPESSASASLDTIAEPAAADQTCDVVETKHVDEDAKKLTVDTAKATEPAAPSQMLACLEKSSKIDDLKSVIYPSGINAPLASLNANATGGKFKYDKEFLLQFQKVYTDKPMSNWDERLKETIGDMDSRGGKPGMGGRSGSNRGTPTTGSPFSGSGLPNFNPKPLGSSADRFSQSTKMLSNGIDPKLALGTQPFERGATFKPGMARTNTLPPPRADSKRGGKPGAMGGRVPSNRPDKNQVGAPTIAPEDVKPLANSGNRWQPKRAAAESEPLPGGEDTQMAPEMVQRKVKGLLNKLTVDNFDRISDQILEIASQSKNETDGRTLRQVIALTFEKATDEAHFSNMYARFCRKMMETIDPSVSDDSLKNKDGVPITGGVLFRKYLLTRCQEDFERGWKSQLPPKPEGEAQTEEAAMLSDEYYIEAAAKRRGLGLVRFVGEVYKLGMLNEKIMHQIIVKLLSNVKEPEEDEVESVTKLITTVGASFDASERGASLMNAYVVRLEEMAENKNISSRHRFMLMDVLDLRKAKWIGGADTKGPKTIQEIHDEAARAAAAKEAQRGPSHRGGPPGGGGGRMEFGRGDVRSGSRRQESHGPTITTSADGWKSVRSAGDLASFGKFADRSASKQSSFGPGGSLAQNARNTAPGRSAAGSRNPSHAGTSREDSRTMSQQPANAFAVLQGDDGEPKDEEETAAATEESSAGRPRLNLLPKGATPGEEDGEATPTEDGSSRPRLSLLPKGATSGEEPVMAPKSTDEGSEKDDTEDAENEDEPAETDEADNERD
ncbi:hypothetical protein BCR37DRAFT_365615 [Protomyces lactucae-debilis]|uniref:MIF4G domain-containing protein n=1 Tax=Protomyces lactucae-debilis TaxID=2754530 RepID=A0A1Y2FLK8_PROLT|nr:uncharacterized protein BCR37DRAFT_365615 [Protomyces lactucae-debilis]ORY84819.1 hypothetical protein BCR37DRAFT_365615 [Protomyces lactucae-debilis]